MKNQMLKIPDGEKIIKKFETKNLFVAVTENKLYIESDGVVFVIKNSAIGVIQIIRKNAKSCYLRLYSESGKDLFPFAERARIGFLGAKESMEFQQILSDIICGVKPKQ